ncbi:hypothetical protein [Natronolimnobius baerhuensis]|uniref:Uncharacterized protein n=1 Tax=Natronolimnobius baerhuensis TaxID=253108 RepID=A0A202E4B2_9EURY|nr:hypothetical protein [Natronolimnobius baerhuensis]OVE83146.1 hypothetical protein B2G88_17195 [Natronolimnobius baerhuensis]
MTDSNVDTHADRDSIEQRLRAGAERSRLTATTRTLARYVRHSWCYRWLTKEPDPDVIVIDLRETYTVGPFIRILDAIIAQFARAAHSSRAVDIGRDIAARFERRPLRVLGIATLAALSISLLLSVALSQTGTLWLGAHVALAGAAALGLRSERTLEDLTETRTWELLSAAFEPPEPPESEAHEASADEETTPDADADTNRC